MMGPVKLWGFIAWLTWALVHLWYLVGFRNRLVVFTNWIWAYVIEQHGARVITGRGATSAPPAAAEASVHQRGDAADDAEVRLGR
jgi:NADH dehydrogenase